MSTTEYDLGDGVPVLFTWPHSFVVNVQISAWFKRNPYTYSPTPGYGSAPTPWSWCPGVFTGTLGGTTTDVTSSFRSCIVTYQSTQLTTAAALTNPW